MWVVRQSQKQGVVCSARPPGQEGQRKQTKTARLGFRTRVHLHQEGIMCLEDAREQVLQPVALAHAHAVRIRQSHVNAEGNQLLRDKVLTKQVGAPDCGTKTAIAIAVGTQT